jgi:hypothetical protein
MRRVLASLPLVADVTMHAPSCVPLLGEGTGVVCVRQHRGYVWAEGEEGGGSEEEWLRPLADRGMLGALLWLQTIMVPGGWC